MGPQGYFKASPITRLLFAVCCACSYRFVARVAVHLQSVIEKFAHDALLAISSPSELSENAVSSSLSALKASGSIKSSESSKSRRRLTEIREDANEAHGQEVDASDEGKERVKVHTHVQKPVEREIQASTTEKEPEKTGDVHRGAAANSGEIEQPLDIPGSGFQGSKAENVPDSQQQSERPGTQPQKRISFESRQSSQSLRPSISDIPSAYRIKPKVKVGPRPSIDSTPAPSSARPVSSLPAGVQMLQRQPKYQAERPKTQQNPSKPFFIGSANSRPMPIAASVTGSTRIDRPPSRAGSAITVPAYTHYPDSLASETQVPHVTPEKQRLMKALQKRRKAKMAKTSAEEAKPNDSEASHSTEEPVSTIREQGPINDIVSSTQGTDSPSDNEDIATTHRAQLLMPQSLTGEETPKARAVDISTPPFMDENALELSEEGNSKANQASSGPPLEGIGEEASPTIHPEKTTDGNKISPNRPEHATDVCRSPTLEAASAEEGHAETDGEANAERGALTSIDHAAAADHVRPMKPPTINQDLEVEAMSSSNAIDTTAEAGEEAESITKMPFSKTDPPAPNMFMAEGLAVSQELEEKLAVKEARELEASGTEDLAFAEKMQSKRRGMITPIRTGDLSDATSLSGDSFLEELQTATFEEAKPMIVSKSPATPFFPLSPKSVGSQRSSEGTRGAKGPSSANEDSTPPVPSNSGSPISAKETRSGSFGSLARFLPARSISNPLDSLPLQKALPDLPDGLSREPSSSSLVQRQGSPAETSGSKKSGVSSMISQRIKALEKFSSGPQTNSNTPMMTQSMVSRRKTSLTTPPVSAGGDTRESSGPSSPAGFPFSSPTSHASSLVRRLRPSRDTSFESKQEGLSVTAKIVRDDSNRVPTQPINAAEPQAVNLHVSPLTVQHKTPSSLFKTPKKASRSKSKSSSTSSLSSSRDGGAPSKRDSMSSRRSTSSRTDSVETVRPRSIASIDRAASPEGEAKDSKKRSLLKRMSNISFSRRSIAQTMNPTLNQQPIMEHQEPDTPSGWTSAVNIGDLNIQFPDTLAREPGDCLCYVKLTSRAALETTPFRGRRPGELDPCSVSTRQGNFLVEAVDRQGHTLTKTSELSHWRSEVPHQRIQKAIHSRP